MTAQEPKKKLKKLSSRLLEPNDAIRVLYVEDAEVIRDTIARLLELNGYKVAYAKNGQEGVAMASRWNPDVVLMDLRMPVMDGFKALEQIKANPQTKHIPVFVISAWSGKKERTQAKISGADGFFVKPPDLNKLIETIENAVKTSGRR
ncbi:MAG: response regulator [Anaerolineae bacterium]|nr:response regulator [Anaerolineae bacterium]